MGSVGILGIVWDLCDLGGRRFPVSTNLPESSWGPDDHRPRGQMFGGQMYRGPHDRPSEKGEFVWFCSNLRALRLKRMCLSCTYICLLYIKNSVSRHNFTVHLGKSCTESKCT